MCKKVDFKKDYNDLYGDVIDLPGAVIIIDEVDRNRAKKFLVNVKSEKGRTS